MVDTLNLANLVVDSSGRASFSGLGSGIDFQDAIDKIVAAKRTPIDTLESRITANDDKITAYKDLRDSLSALKNAVSRLRGAISVGSVDNVFKAKSAFASTFRTDGVTPSAAANLLGVNVTNSAAIGVHDIEIRRVATAHKVSTKAFTSTSTALNLSGTFAVEGTSITVNTTDTLADIRDRINNANTGTSPTGVTASIVTVSSTENYLVLTKDATGSAMVVTETDSGTLLSGLGLSTTHGAGAFRNGLGASSKIAPASGFRDIVFDGTQADNAFLISYDSTTKVLTLTRGDGTTDTATVSSSTIAAGSSETLTFSTFGATIVIDSSFDKATDITVAADAASVTGGTGAIDPATVQISDSAGDISGITTSTLALGSLTTPAAISISVGAFTGTFDGTTTGTKTVTLSDGGGNSLTIKFNVSAAFDGTETAGSITLNELQNLVGASGARYSNELQTAQTARLTADGLADSTHYESARVTSKTAQLSTFLTNATFPGSFDINGTGTATINYVSTDTLETLASKINAQQGTTGVTATVVADANGFRLDLDSSTAFTLTDTNGLVADLGINNALVIERTSNTVSDLFSGMTLSLFAEEQGTTIKVEVDQDLTSIKTEIQGFVDAYNATRQLINQHSLTDPNTGAKAADAGVLFGARTLSDIRARLANLAGQDVVGVSSSFATLAQVGISFIDNDTVEDPLLKNTLVLDEQTLDQALLNNPDDVRRLFTFDFSSSSPEVALVDFTANTSFSSTGYVLNIGTVGQLHQNSAAVTDKTVALNQATSLGATTSGTFQVNGANVTYDVTTDTLETLVTAINTASATAGNGVTASIKTDSNGKFFIRLDSTQSTISLTGDTGDLVSLLNVQPDPDEVDSANIGGAANGADDGTATTSGRLITVTSQSNAEGLKVFYSGTGSTSGVQIDFTVGVGAQLFFAIDSFVDQSTGAIQAEINTLEDQNTFAQDRITQMEDRLAIFQASLTDRFVAAETALTQMKSMVDRLKQQFGALSGNS